MTPSSARDRGRDQPANTAKQTSDSHAASCKQREDAPWRCERHEYLCARPAKQLLSALPLTHRALLFISASTGTSGPSVRSTHPVSHAHRLLDHMRADAPCALYAPHPIQCAGSESNGFHKSCPAPRRARFTSSPPASHDVLRGLLRTRGDHWRSMNAASRALAIPRETRARTKLDAVTPKRGGPRRACAHPR